MPTAGYSGTPLAKKLGIRQGCRIAVYYQPEYYFELFTDFPGDVTIAGPTAAVDFIHYFARKEEQLAKDLSTLKGRIAQKGIIWVSWPKKSSGVVTDITEDVIRKMALQNGLVDVKVCAVDETWSGLKLVIPLRLRK